MKLNSKLSKPQCDLEGMDGALAHHSRVSRPGLQLVMMASVISIVGISAAQSETPEDYRCGKGEDVRRIEIRFEDESGRFPCRVIYRPEIESDAVGTVSWRGISTLEACEGQATELVDRLTAEGWNCALQTDRSESTPLQASTGQRLEAVEEPLSIDDTSSSPNPNQAEQDGAADQLIDRAALVDNPALDAPSPALAALLKEDLAKLDITLDGELEAQIAAYSDLNADDIEDALVLLTYKAPQPAYRQFLAAYLFDGETYQLTATRPVGSSSNATMNAKVDYVDQGIIHLTLQAFEPGDASCCPSGLQQFSLALRDLDLVAIDETTAIR